MYEIKHHVYWNIWEVVYYTSNGLLMPIRKFDSEAQARKFIQTKREQEYE
jgi:hypothetical protein